MKLIGWKYNAPADYRANKILRSLARTPVSRCVHLAAESGVLHEARHQPSDSIAGAVVRLVVNWRAKIHCAANDVLDVFIGEMGFQPIHVMLGKTEADGGVQHQPRAIPLRIEVCVDQDAVRILVSRHVPLSHILPIPQRPKRRK